MLLPMSNEGVICQNRLSWLAGRAYAEEKVYAALVET